MSQDPQEPIITFEDILLQCNIDELLPEEGEKLSSTEKLSLLVDDITCEVDAEAMLISFAVNSGFTPSQTAELEAKYDGNLYTSAAIGLEIENREELMTQVISFAVSEVRRYMAMTEEEKANLSEEENEAFEQIQQDLCTFLEAAYTREIYTGEKLRQQFIDAVLDITEEEKHRPEDSPVRINIKLGVLEVIEEMPSMNQKERSEILLTIGKLTDFNPFTMNTVLLEKAVDERIALVMNEFLNRWYSSEKLNMIKLREIGTIIDTLEKYGADTDFIYAINEFSTGDKLDHEIQSSQKQSKRTLMAVTPYFAGGFELSQGNPISMYNLCQLARRNARNGVGFDTVESQTEIAARLRAIDAEVTDEMPILGIAEPTIHISSPLSVQRAENTYLWTKAGMIQLTTHAINNKPGSEIKRASGHERAHSLRVYIGSALDNIGIKGLKMIPAPHEEFFAIVTEATMNTSTQYQLDYPEIPTYPNVSEIEIPIYGKNMSSAILYSQQLPKGHAIYCVMKRVESQRRNSEFYTEKNAEHLNNYTQRIYDDFFRDMGIDSGKQSLARVFTIPTDGLRYASGGSGQLSTDAISILRDRSTNKEAPLADKDMRAVFYSLMVHMKDSSSPSVEWTNYLETVTVEEAYELLASVGISEERV